MHGATGLPLAGDATPGFTRVRPVANAAVIPHTIQVVAGCDDRYARHLAVMLLSLFAHSSARPVHVHILIPADFTERARLEAVLGSDAARVSFHAIADAPLRTLRQRPDLTAATYYRLLIGAALPAALDRVIYLDCDTMIRRELTDLWETPLDRMVAAAVPDPGFFERQTLGLPDDAPYFNAGVLLIDLARWRAERIGEAAHAFAGENPERLTYQDQCALNWVLRDRWVTLDPAWNVLTGTISRWIDGHLDYANPLPPHAAAARIVHFNAPGRPWLYMDEHPFKPTYLAYRARTPWHDVRPPDRYPHNIIIKTLKRHAPALLPVYRLIRRYI
jgi:lipopolysaccharide biosynthesis glycosyltransferase